MWVWVNIENTLSVSVSVSLSLSQCFSLSVFSFLSMQIAAKMVTKCLLHSVLQECGLEPNKYLSQIVHIYLSIYLSQTVDIYQFINLRACLVAEIVAYSSLLFLISIRILGRLTLHNHLVLVCTRLLVPLRINSVIWMSYMWFISLYGFDIFI